MGKRMKTDASDFKFFVIWAALRLKLRERLILQENVPCPASFLLQSTSECECLVGGEVPEPCWLPVLVGCRKLSYRNEETAISIQVGMLGDLIEKESFIAPPLQQLATKRLIPLIPCWIKKGAV